MRGPISLFNTPPTTPFPDVELAMIEPNGLLAIGGDLSPTRLLNAYRHGIFPWYSDDQPIVWWSPDPRLVLFPDELHVSRSMRKTMKREPFNVTIDKAFKEVMLACARPRPKQNGTWITNEIFSAYNELHELGYAHSVECWYDSELVGGLYGIAMGKVFFGESMFSTMSDASKVGFITLVQKLKAWEFELIDCQVETEHLQSLGARNIPRQEFVKLLDQHCVVQFPEPGWHAHTPMKQ